MPICQYLSSLFPDSRIDPFATNRIGQIAETPILRPTVKVRDHAFGVLGVGWRIKETAAAASVVDLFENARHDGLSERGKEEKRERSPAGDCGESRFVGSNHGKALPSATAGKGKACAMPPRVGFQVF